MIISVINHKGGTGKTTSVINIGAFLAKKGFSVLLVDLDSQANTSQALMSDKDYSIMDAIESGKVDVNEVFRYSNKISVLSSNLKVYNLEKVLSDKTIAREKVVSKLLEPLKNYFDFIIIDNPPSLGVTALNSVISADKVLIPLEAEFFSQKGLDNLILFFNEAKDAYNLNNDILGVFLTKYMEKTKLANYFISEFGSDSDYQNLFLNTKIRKNVKIGESHLDGKTILDYAPDSIGAMDYENLTKEILTKLKM